MALPEEGELKFWESADESSSWNAVVCFRVCCCSMGNNLICRPFICRPSEDPCSLETQLASVQLTMTLGSSAPSLIDVVARRRKALNTEQWSDGEPAEAEKDFWEIAAMEAYNHLMEWKSLQYCSTVCIDEASPPDLEKMWAEPLHQVHF